MTLLPAMMRRGEMVRRVTCRDHLRRLGVATHLYAAQNHGWLIPHLRNYPDWYIGSFSSLMFVQLTNLVGEVAIDCPNLYPYTIPGQVDEPGGRHQRSWGVIVGYNYLGGIPAANMPAPSGWYSPLRDAEDPLMLLYTDSNNSGWDTQVGRYAAMAPHGARGLVRILGSSYIHIDWPLTPRDIGAEGGNVCTLGGAVEWKPIARMRSDYWCAQGDGGWRATW
jgi:hypothetical protein